MGTVVITGALGGVGEWFVDHFLTEGWEVVALDLETPDESPEGVDCRAVDLTTQGETWELVQTADPDAVVHLAAYNWTGIVSGTKTFLDNVTSTYNVLSAAGTADVPAVNFSSLSAYGYFVDRSPEYVPVDERHPLSPDDEYAASKIVGETVAELLAGKHAIDIGSVRPAWVNFPNTFQVLESDDRDDPAGGDGALWSYIDVRDLATLAGAILAADFSGHEAFNATAGDTYLTVPTRDALSEAYDFSPENVAIEGQGSIFSLRKAEETTGWTPSHSWHTAADEPVSHPDLFG